MLKLKNLINLSPTAFRLACAIGLATGFTLAGYEFVRSPTNTLFMQYYGKENLPLVMAAVPFGVIVIVYLYSRLLTRLGPRRTLIWSTVGSAGIIALGWLAVRYDIKEASALLYVFRSAYVVLLIEQYWSLINSSLSVAEAKRLNGPISGLGSLGAILGGLGGERLTGIFGTKEVILVAAALTFLAFILSATAYHFGARSIAGTSRDGEFDHGSKPKGTHLGLELFKENRMLVFLLAIVLLTQGLITTLGIIFQNQLFDTFPNPDGQTAYSFRFYAQINMVAGISQFIVAPLLMTRVRNHFVQVAMPAVMLLALGNYLMDPGLQTAGLAFLIFKAMDYSLFRASKEVYYIPMSFDARFRTKEVIDIFGYRFGKGGAAGLFDIIQRLGFRFTELSYGVWAFAYTSLWLGITLLVARHAGLDRKAELAAKKAEEI